MQFFVQGPKVERPENCSRFILKYLIRELAKQKSNFRKFPYLHYLCAMMILYRIYQVCIMLPVLLVATFLTALFTIVGSMLGMSRAWGYYPAKWWSRLFCLMTFVSVKVEGRENINPKTSYVFVANHQGAYDIFSIYGYLNHNFRWMMKVGLSKIPFVGYACKRAGHIMVDSSSPAAVKNTMEAAERQLRGGMSLVVFPEGARSRTGKMGRFKKGAFALAVEFGLPVVPVTINGAYEVMPRSAKLPRPGKITLTIHRPIMPSAEGHDMAQLIEESYRQVQSSLYERYK